MEITLTEVTIGTVVAFIVNTIKITTKWNKQDNKIENLENRIQDNEAGDKELKVKVESLNRLYTKIELLESKQISQSDTMNTTLTSLNASIGNLNSKLDIFVESYNKLNTDVEVLKSKSNASS